jgi:hypothetical protein
MAAKKLVRGKRVFDTRADTVDPRDHLYVPTPAPIPGDISLDIYQRLRAPILDQGTEPGAVGFALATTAHYLLRRRNVSAGGEPVSPGMLYGMARRYDEWAEEQVSGSSARAALKGWHKHGVCRASLWRGAPVGSNVVLTSQRANDAQMRPLAQYFRIDHRSLGAMQAALAEVGILFATAVVHDGWNNPDQQGHLPLGTAEFGLHAFAIVAYDYYGFWVQNSWGREWGRAGFGRISYDDWLMHGADVWVARLGVAVRLDPADRKSDRHVRVQGALVRPELRPHIVKIGDDGGLGETGPYGNSKADIDSIFQNEFPRITAGWDRKRILLIATCGLESQPVVLDRAEKYLRHLLPQQIFPIVFDWSNGISDALCKALHSALRRRAPTNSNGAASGFMMDRLDDTLERLVRAPGKLLWDELKERAFAASVHVGGGARLVAGHIAHLLQEDSDVELNVVAHGAGAIFLAPLVRMFTTSGQIKAGPLSGGSGYGLGIGSCTLWAPACTMDLFYSCYAPSIQSGRVNRFASFVLREDLERSDGCSDIYQKSLLYLVSNALESTVRVPAMRDGVALLGMQKFVDRDETIRGLVSSGLVELVIAPNDEPLGSPRACAAREHAAFDDEATLYGLIARIRGDAATPLEALSTASSVLSSQVMRHLVAA